MALKGNLRDFTAPQLLNLINVARKTGTLSVEAQGERVLLYFKEGKLAYAQFRDEDNSLAAILYKAKKLNSAQYHKLREKAGKMSDKELGLLLINANYVSQQDILASLQSFLLSLINRLFTWREGSFIFENDRLPPDNRIILRIGLENIIIEGSRKAKELVELQDEIPSLDMALKFSQRPGTNIKDLNLSVEEWRVIRYVNPKNTMRQIASAAKLSEMEARRIIYRLLQAGLVEITRPVSYAPSLAAQGRLPVLQKTKEEQKSLINRIISRIRSI